MALFPCAECGHMVSDKAVTCPNCGAPVTVLSASDTPLSMTPPPAAPQIVTQQKSNGGCLTKGFQAVGFVVIAFLMLGWMLSKCDVPAPPKTPVTEQPKVKPPSEEDKANWVKGYQTKTEAADMRLFYANRLIRFFPDSPEAQAAKAALPKLQKAAKPILDRKNAKWVYRSVADKMTSKQAKHAILVSNNTFNFNSPYQGEQHATLSFRNHPTHGRDVIFSLDKGQIDCSAIECRVRIRFGEGKAITYKANPSSDGSFNVIFIGGYAAIMSRMQKVDHIKVEFQVYQEGVHVAEFDVRGFDPKRL